MVSHNKRTTNGASESKSRSPGSQHVLLPGVPTNDLGLKIAQVSLDWFKGKFEPETAIHLMDFNGKYHGFL